MTFAVGVVAVGDLLAGTVDHALGPFKAVVGVGGGARTVDHLGSASVRVVAVGDRVWGGVAAVGMGRV